MDQQALVDDINSNWEEIPLKYDNFMELYGPEEEDEEEIDPEEQQKKRDLENAFKYALTLKSKPVQAKKSPKKVIEDALKAQIIQKEHIDSVAKDIIEKRVMVRKINEAMDALDKVVRKEMRPKEDKETEESTLLRLVQKDFIKQQRYLVTAVTKLFGNHEKEANLILNDLFDAHFDDETEKYVDVSQRNEVVVKTLLDSYLVVTHKDYPQKIKLRPIL